MKPDSYDKLYQMATTPEALAETSAYLADRMRPFLSIQEPVLICFPDQGPESLGAVFAEAVRSCGGNPVLWGPDFRWKELLRLAFASHANTLIGHPLVVLGLLKLAKATSTPLYFYDVVLSGYPYARWMVESVKKGLDCKVWGCYSIRSGPVITGFSCAQEAGIHIRDHLYEAVVSNPDGSITQDYKRGALKYFSRTDTKVEYDPEESAIMHHQPCSCGCDSPRIVETLYTGTGNLGKTMLEQRFLTWTSILDYRARQTESGVDLELVVFPGESMPKLPNCAKLTIRPWNPETDIPFYIADNFVKIPEKSW